MGGLTAGYCFCVILLVSVVVVVVAVVFCLLVIFAPLSLSLGMAVQGSSLYGIALLLFEKLRSQLFEDEESTAVDLAWHLVLFAVVAVVDLSQ